MRQFKDSEEWKCLNNIWRKLPTNIREECYSDFQLLNNKLKQAWEIENLPEERAEDDNFRYIDPLSEDARNLFFYALNHKKLNLYHSAMSVIAGHGLHGMTEAIEFYFERYAKKRPYIAENANAMREIIALCYSRLEERQEP